MPVGTLQKVQDRIIANLTKNGAELISFEKVARCVTDARVVTKQNHTPQSYEHSGFPSLVN